MQIIVPKPLQFQKCYPENSLTFSNHVHKNVQGKMGAEGSATSWVQIQALRGHGQVREDITVSCFLLGEWGARQYSLVVQIAGFIFNLGLSRTAFSICKYLKWRAQLNRWGSDFLGWDWLHLTAVFLYLGSVMKQTFLRKYLSSLDSQNEKEKWL